MEDLVKMYLESNACGLSDGAKKAHVHKLLCESFLVDRFGSVIKSIKGYNSLRSKVRESTLPLTDYLDEAIGFPLDKAPNYNKMVPAFLNMFLELATGYIQEHTDLLTQQELSATLDKICKYSLSSRTYYALDSYGFSFVEGVAGKFLIMESRLGDKVKVVPNRYFGCKWEKLGEI